VQAALHVRDAVREFLPELGWPAPLYYGMSGSGGMIVYEVNEPNDDSTTVLVRAALVALAAQFESEHGKIDPRVWNAARLTKIPGTIGAKGDHCPYLGRVWRQATAELCDDAALVPRSRLEALAALAPAASSATPQLLRSDPAGRGWTPAEITAAL